MKRIIRFPILCIIMSLSTSIVSAFKQPVHRLDFYNSISRLRNFELHVQLLRGKHYSREVPTLLRAANIGSSDKDENHRTLSLGEHVSEIEIKKSRFISHAKNVENWIQAKDYINELHKKHPKARHWCYGFQCGMNPVQERSSDDGEPTGTAGAPILGAIRGENLSDVVCIVVRYSGGIKLGAGGLIRAYGGAARQVLREAPIVVYEPKSNIRLSVSNSFVGSIYEITSRYQGSLSEEEYKADGNLEITITCDTSREVKIRETLTDATRGSITFLH